MTAVANETALRRGSSDVSAGWQGVEPVTDSPMTDDELGLKAALAKYSPRDHTEGSDLTADVAVAELADDVHTWVSETGGAATQWWHRPATRKSEAISGFHKWEGRIVDIDGDLFTAELMPLEPDVDGPNVYGDFELELLGPDEVAVGDLIYVTARLVTVTPGMPPTKTLSVRLRRIGNWSESDAKEIAESAAQAWSQLQDLVE